MLVWKIFTGIFSDPDGGELTYTVSAPADRNHLLESLQTRLGVGSGEEKHDFLFLEMDAEDDWKSLSPALPDPFTTTVTLTATDPDGLSASVTGDFLTNWDSEPALVSATAGPQAVELTFDQDVKPNLTPSRFTVNVVNEDGSTGTVSVSSLLVNGNVVTLTLASALQEGQTVTVDYAHDDDAPLQRVGGGDSAPGFTGQAVEVSLPPEPVDAAPGGLSLEPVLDAEGNPGANIVRASWNPVPNAASYTLSWRRDGAGSPPVTQTQTQAQAQGANDRKSGIASGPSAQGGPSGASDGGGQANNGHGDNELTLPGDQTSADIDLNDHGLWHVDLEVHGDDDELITSFQETVEIRVNAWLNARTSYVFDGSLRLSGCQHRTITGIRVTFIQDVVEVTWDDPNIPAITGYQYRFQRDGSFRFPARSENDWHDAVLESNTGVPTFRMGVAHPNLISAGNITHLAFNRTNALWLRAVAGSQVYCFEHLYWIKPFDVKVPLITGLEAFQTYDDGPNQLTLSWDDPGDDNLNYDYWYTAFTPDWLGTGGRYPGGSPRGQATGWVRWSRRMTRLPAMRGGQAPGHPQRDTLQLPELRRPHPGQQGQQPAGPRHRGGEHQPGLHRFRLSIL